MNLADRGNVKKILDNQNFTFKKSLGQNFIIDSGVCPAMAQAAADSTTGVLEIGPGAGVLTRELSDVAKRVVAIEIDERLRPVLSKTLADCNNTEVVFGDVMKIDLKALIKEKFSDCENITVCANLPYYITSPVIMLLLESKLPISSVTAMVQKEAAERLCARMGQRAAGAVTAAVEYYSDAEILFEVPRTCFLPPPKVDSAVIKLNIRKEPPVNTADEKKLFALVKACFAQRRKTLLNTVSNTMGINKDVLRAALAELSLPEDVRGERLTLARLAQLADRL